MSREVMPVRGGCMLLALLSCALAVCDGANAPDRSPAAGTNEIARPAGTFRELFQRGGQVYLAGGYKQAAGIYQEAVALRPSSGALHNLGNAEYLAGRVGPAILAWERAHWLDPYFENTKANLRFARKQAQIDEPNLAWYEICSTWLPMNAWTWLAGISLWVAVAMVMLPGIFHWRKADWHQGLAAAGFAIFLVTLPALLGVHTRSQLGVVLEKDTRLRLTPTREAQDIAHLPAGELGRVEQRRGEYFYIRLANDAAGWVDQERFQLIGGAMPRKTAELATMGPR